MSGSSPTSGSGTRLTAPKRSRRSNTASAPSTPVSAATAAARPSASRSTTGRNGARNQPAPRRKGGSDEDRAAGRGWHDAGRDARRTGRKGVLGRLFEGPDRG